MGETEKPFSCCMPGCSLSFVSADHLEVHRKKHDMCLNLEAGIQRHLSGYVDQTPTPTRLIRNCDEVGLFPDLQHVVVNPFDEQFRKATERRVSSVSESSVLSSSEDALHTPQVFPEPLTPNTRGVLKSLISQDDSPPQEVTSKGDPTSEGSSQQQLKIIIPLTLNLPGGQSMQGQQIGVNVTLPPKKEDGRELKQKLDASRPLVPVVPVSGTTIQKADSSSVRPPTKRMMLSEKEERNRRFRERNKAAAIRSRKKRKEWISDIQHKCSVLSKTNHSLQEKVNLLTAEVAKLKQQLQLHASCTVTLKQQEKASLGGISALASVSNKQTLVSSSNVAPMGSSPTLAPMGTSPTLASMGTSPNLAPVSTSSPTLAPIGSGQQMFLLGNMPVLPTTSPTQPQVFVLTQGRPPAPPPIQPKRVAILPKTCASTPSVRSATTMVTAGSTVVAGGSYKDENPPSSFDDLVCLREFGKLDPNIGKSSVITSTANMQTVIVQGPSASKHP